MSGARFKETLHIRLQKVLGARPQRRRRRPPLSAPIALFSSAAHRVRHEVGDGNGRATPNTGSPSGARRTERGDASDVALHRSETASDIQLYTKKVSSASISMVWRVVVIRKSKSSLRRMACMHALGVRVAPPAMIRQQSEPNRPCSQMPVP